MAEILIIHGPNLNLLGGRQTEIYGSKTLEDINREIEEKASALNLSPIFFQSNHEGDIVDEIGKTDAEAIIINPAAFTHTSVAVRDALEAYKGAVVEVHLSNIFAREDFRHKSLTAAAADGLVCGFSSHSYILAMEAAAKLIQKKE